MALRGADAVHLASALVLQSRLVDAEDRLIFVAADRELKEAAQASGLAIIDPEEQEQQMMSDAGDGAQEENEASPNPRQSWHPTSRTRLPFSPQFIIHMILTN